MLTRACVVCCTILASPVRPLPAEVVQVFILAGQSNAVGSDSDANLLPPELYAPQTDVLFWYEEGPLGAVWNHWYRITSGNQFVPLQFQSDPSGLTFNIPDAFGPEITLGRQLADSLSEQVAIVKLAFDATSLVFDWDPDRPWSLYAELLDLIDTVEAAAAAAGYSADLAGFFWMQGESEAWMTDQIAAGYQDDLAHLINHLRTDLGLPDFPFILGRLHCDIWRSTYGITPARLAMVRQAQTTVGTSTPHVSMVNTDDLPLVSDWIHFAAPGQMGLGSRFAVAWLNLVLPVPGDSDLDRDVDSDDYEAFTSCSTGPGLPQIDPSCVWARLDDDDDVDQVDFGLLQQCFSGSGVPGLPDCIQ